MITYTDPKQTMKKIFETAFLEVMRKYNIEGELRVESLITHLNKEKIIISILRTVDLFNGLRLSSKTPMLSVTVSVSYLEDLEVDIGQAFKVVLFRDKIINLNDEIKDLCHRFFIEINRKSILRG